MREKMQMNKMSHEIKRQQEKEFLQQIRALEDLESKRKLSSMNALNEDFMFYNGNLQKENVELKKKE